MTNGQTVHRWEKLAEDIGRGRTDGIVIDGREMVDGEHGGDSCIAGEELDRLILFCILDVVLVLLMVARLF